MDNSIKKKLLITGSTGLLGSNLRKILQYKFQISGVARTYISPYVDLQVDITNFRDLKSVMSKLKPDVVVHCAAIASHKDCDENKIYAKKLNFLSTLDLANLSAELDAKFVFISTDAVFSGNSSWYSEIDEVNPFSYYGELKVLAETYLVKNINNYLILRGSFFGQSLNKKNSIFDFFYQNLKKSKNIYGIYDIYSNSIDIFTLSKIIGELLDSDAYGIFHYGLPEKYSKLEFGDHIAKKLSAKKNLITPSNADSMNDSYLFPRDLSLDIKKLQNTINIQIPSLLDSLENIISN